MKKIILSIILIFTGIAANASNEDATLTDIKESLYYLIKDYKTLKNKTALTKKEIKILKSKEAEIEQKIKEMDDIRKEINNIKNKFHFTEQKNDADDEIINKFINDNDKR